MTTQEKLDINKKIRAYKGNNSFLLSLKKSLLGKYCQKITIGNKSYKVLSDKQYESAITNPEIRDPQ
jgi:hypothetical protein